MGPSLNKPTNLTAVINQNTGLVELSWQDNSINETGFRIDYCNQPFTLATLGLPYCAVGGSSLYLPENSISYYFGSGILDPETTYYFNVRAYINSVVNYYSYSGYGNFAPVTTP